MSDVVDITAESRLKMSASTCVGKSAAASAWFGPHAGDFAGFEKTAASLGSTLSKEGANWFLVRLSAPALKWQLAQAVLPSLPIFISQKSALPSRIAAGLSTT